MDREVLRGQVLRVVALRELRLDQVHEVGRLRRCRTTALSTRSGCAMAASRRRRVDEARLLHRAQHLVAPLHRALGVAVRVVGVGRLDHARPAARSRRASGCRRPCGSTCARPRRRRGCRTSRPGPGRPRSGTAPGCPSCPRAAPARTRAAPPATLRCMRALRRQEEVLHELLRDGAAALDVALGLACCARPRPRCGRGRGRDG